MNLKGLSERVVAALVALAVVGVFLFATVWSVLNSPEGETTKVLVNALVTVGFAGVMAYIFTRDRGDGGS